jgi:LemA protein
MGSDPVSQEKTMRQTQNSMVVRFAVLAGLVVLALPLSGCSYNQFVAMDEGVKAQLAQVENQLQRRNDLIPNLVSTVKGYVTHEAGVFEAVAESRAKLAGAKTPEDTFAAANAQSSALSRLLLVVENYPQLKANEQFARLSDELSGTENRIATERKRYNDKVQEYNTLRRKFPSNITASLFSFKEHPFFQAPPEAKQVPKVDFAK